VKRLRMHRLIKKVRNTYRYHLTRLGERVIAAGLQLREYCIVPALAAARS
jgi:predicted MarR family transcription regulator